MKRKIVFQKLIDGHYDLSTQLQVFNWMLRSGQPYNEYIGRWSRVGVDQCLYGYSANNYSSMTNLLPSIEQNLMLGFVRAIVRTPNIVVEKWRKKEGIGLGKFRMLDISEDYPKQGEINGRSDGHWWLSGQIYSLKDALGKELKKEFFHPDYPNRTAPKFLSHSLSTCGNGYVLSYTFSFLECNNYDPGWDYNMYQKKDESIDLFINRAHSHLKTLYLEI